MRVITIQIQRNRPRETSWKNPYDSGLSPFWQYFSDFVANGVLIDSARNLHGLCRVRADSCGCPRGSANPAKNPPRIFYSRRVLVDSMDFFLRNQCGIPESTKLRGGVCFAESADFCGRPQESAQIPHRFRTKFARSPRGVRGVHAESVESTRSPWSPLGVWSPRSPCRVCVESSESAWSPHGVCSESAIKHR